MDIKYFGYAIEIMECGSINKAARNLQMLQPNLSVCIKNLKREPSLPIFYQQHSGVRLTSEGELLLKSARKITTEPETIHSILSMFSHKDNLSISCTYSFNFMSRFLKFKRKKPPTACEDPLKGTSLIQAIRDVVEQRYRMSLFYCFDTVSNTYYTLAKKHNLKLIPVARNRSLILLASKKNPLSRKEGIPFDSITGYKFIMYENFRFDEWLKILNFKNNNSVLYVFDRGGLVDAIRQSRYVTVMMRRLTDAYSEDCVEVFIVGLLFGMDAYCLRHASYTMSSREKQFIRGLGELFAENPAQRPIQMSRNCLAIETAAFPPLPPSSIGTVTTDCDDSAGANPMSQA